MALAMRSQRVALHRPVVGVRPVSARSVRVKAVLEYPCPELKKFCEENFPEKGLATPDEATCLFSQLGYTWIDVRPTLELDLNGKSKHAVHIPFINAKYQYDPETKAKKVIKEPNPDFINIVKKRFPDKKAKIMIGCSDFKTYSIDALEMLEGEGYENLVALQGGFNKWYAMFDTNLRRRNYGEYKENYMGEGSDSCGIHASGAGFDRVDAVEKWKPRTL